MKKAKTESGERIDYIVCDLSAWAWMVTAWTSVVTVISNNELKKHETV